MNKKISKKKVILSVFFILVLIISISYFMIFYKNDLFLVNDISTHNSIFSDFIDSSVLLYENSLSYNGYNVCDNFLFDMEGNLISKMPFDFVWDFDPSHLVYFKVENDGILNIINRDNSSKKVEISQIKFDIFFHHDLVFNTNNNNQSFFVIGSEKRYYNNLEIVFDTIYEIDFNGNILWNWSTYENLDDIHKYSDYTYLDCYNNSNCSYDYNFYNDSYQSSFDYFHTNYIQIIPKNKLEENDLRFKEGNLMIDLPSVGQIIIIDYETKKIVFGSNFKNIVGQHCSQILSNGNILIFDNQYPFILNSKNKYSRVVEINPINNEVFWEYNLDEYSRFRSCAQRLPNNNTLITISESGTVIEVTPNKKIVWKWSNPLKLLDKELKDKGTYRLIRVNEFQKELLVNYSKKVVMRNETKN
jgi:hypothetical protein